MRRRKLKEVCAYLKDFCFLGNLEPAIIENFWKYIVKESYIRGQSVFTQGKSQTNGLYFVAEGEFELTI